MTLAELVAVLLAACIAVPVFRRFGFGSVLGYLAAGIALGPYGLGLVDDIEEILHMAEFGVVLLLFIIGLELKPARLWVMRKSVFGLGTAQVLVTSLAIGAFAYWLGVGISTALVIGLGLALSSTAFVLQILAEKKELNAAHGRASFAILLFQDLAVIPILALIPLLGSPAGPTDSVLLQAFISVAAIAFLVIGGRYLLRPAFRYVAAVGGQEIFTAATLLLVVGAAYLMYVAGISMALGAFLAGVVLANSEFRHELESDLEPFKGLLLGLFFITVGAGINFQSFFRDPGDYIGLALLIILAKGVILYVLGRAFRLKGRDRWLFTLSLAQAGELAAAFETPERAMDRDYPRGRFRGVRRILREDLGLVGAAWLARDPAAANDVHARLAKRGAAVASRASARTRADSTPSRASLMTDDTRWSGSGKSSDIPSSSAA